MKRTSKAALSMALSLVVAFASSMPAFAATPEAQNAPAAVVVVSQTDAAAMPSTHDIAAADDMTQLAKAKYKKPKKLKPNKAKRVNLNGAKKAQKVEVKTKWVKQRWGEYEADVIRYQLFIDGKKKATRYSHQSGDGQWHFYYADLNKRDKYKEIIMYQMPTGVDNTKYYIYRYKKGKLASTKATVEIPEYPSYPTNGLTLKKSKWIPGFFNMRISSKGVFEIKLMTDYSEMTTIWIKYKMSKSGKITRVT